MISLQVEKLSKSFGTKTVLRNITFLQQGGVLGIAGANGSGKSTLLKCLAGLLRPTSGTATWLKNETTVSNQQNTLSLGFAAPYVSLYKELSTRENLAFLSKIREPHAFPQNFDDLLAFTGLDHAADMAYGDLSTGQQQRARLSAALFHNPEILLLDEPGSNLDESGRRLIKQIVRQAKEKDKLIILASNNPDELVLCDHVFSVEKEDFTNHL